MHKLAAAPVINSGADNKKRKEKKVSSVLKWRSVLGSLGMQHHAGEAA